MQCGVCMSVCPKHALNIKKATHCYSISVDRDKCVGCGVWAMVCPSHYIYKDRVSFDRITNENVLLTYAKDKNVQFTSSSGGTIRTLAKAFLQQEKSFVYALYEQGNGIQGGVIDKTLVGAMPNSIYAPTMWGRNLQEVKNLQAGSWLLVIGLPCQIKAAKKVIEKFNRQIRVYYIGIICRKTKDFRFEKYIRDFHHIHDDKRVTFRGYGWPGIIGRYDTSQYSQYSQFSLIPFGLDLWNVKGCYRCADCLAQDVADLSVGDPWNLDGINDKGCNITFINSEKGFELLENCKDMLVVSSLTKDEGERVLDRNMITNKINRVRFYCGIDNGFSSKIKYLTLDTKSFLIGMMISGIARYRCVGALGGGIV